MSFENPNDAAFFFDDGDFLNLEEVSAVQWYPLGSADEDTGERSGVAEICIFVKGVESSLTRYDACYPPGSPRGIDKEQKDRLMAALRTYHSKG